MTKLTPRPQEEEQSGKLWYFLAARYYRSSDTFSERIRKNFAGLCAFPLFIIAIAYTAYGFSQAHSPAMYAHNTSMGLLSLTLLFTHLWMRKSRTVTGTHVAVSLWSVALLLSTSYIASPEFDNKALLFTALFVCIKMRHPHLIVICILFALQQLLNDWNVAHIGLNQDRQLVLPDSRVGTSNIQRLIGQVIGSILLSLCGWLFHRAMSETEKREEAQRAATKMTFDILRHQRKYDTDAVSAIIENCQEEGKVSSDLIHLFDQMNENLKTYKPFLPNYVFLPQSDDSNEEETEGDSAAESGAESAGRATKRSNRSKKRGAAPGGSGLSEGALERHDEDDEDLDSEDSRYYRRNERRGSLSSSRSVRSERSTASSQQRKNHQTNKTKRSGSVYSQSSSSAATFKDHERRSVRGGKAGLDAKSSSITTVIAAKKRPAMYQGRVAFAVVDVNLDRLGINFEDNFVTPPGHDLPHQEGFGGGPSQSQPQQHQDHNYSPSEKLHFLMNCVFGLAKETKASVHSMLGDQIQVSWNATSNIPLPETKGAQFLTKLSKSVKKRFDGGNVSGMLCSGVATVHTIITASQQQALLIDAQWVPLLEAGLDLATRHGGRLLMDDSSMNASALEMDSCPVEMIRCRDFGAAAEAKTSSDLQHHEKRVAKFRTLYHENQHQHSPQSGPNSSSSPTNYSSVVESGGVVSMIHELVGEKYRAEDEWMYQLQADANYNSSRKQQGQGGGSSTKSLRPCDYYRECLVHLSEGNKDAAKVSLAAAKELADLSKNSPRSGGGTTRNNTNNSHQSSATTVILPSSSFTKLLEDHLGML